MSGTQEKSFRSKHPAGTRVAPELQAQIESQVVEGQLPCALAFDIAARLGIPAGDVGTALDVFDIRLTKCQLGLFGYQPNKKIVAPAQSVAPELAAAIHAAAAGGHLPCQAAWDLASRLKLRKLAVSNACEALGVKIKPCQLGAF